MASAYKCDRCGTFYDSSDIFKYDGTEDSEAWRYTLVKDCHPYPDHNIDLCPACKVMLYEWIIEYDELNKK